jgi:hypothetical protein
MVGDEEEDALAFRDQSTGRAWEIAPECPVFVRRRLGAPQALELELQVTLTLPRSPVVCSTRLHLQPIDKNVLIPPKNFVCALFSAKP